MNPNPTAKRILCYGDSITYGRIPGMPPRRCPTNERWTGILQELLGSEYEIIEEGLPSRTTDIDDPNYPGRNGLATFRPIIQSHLPLDLVIIFLGTNDFKARFNRSAEQIAQGLEKYTDELKTACAKENNKIPALLFLSPPNIREQYLRNVVEFTGSEEKSKQLAAEIEKFTKKHNVLFLDTAKIVQASVVDGVHLDQESSNCLSEILNEIIRSNP